MEQKKSPRKDINKKRFQLLEIGFILSLTFVFLAFQYKASDSNNNTLGSISGINLESEIIPITKYEKQKPEPPKPKIKIITTVKEVPNDTKKTDDNNDDYWKLLESDFDMDSLLGAFNKEEVVNDTIYFTALLKEKPHFNGDLNSYLKKELKFPENALINNVGGTVYVEFVIEKDGSISNVSIARSVCSDLDAEAKRVIENMPKWSPGKQMGKPVRVRFWQPIKFSISN